jgi:hypothetical protein
VGSFEETYDDDELRSFKPTQLKKLQKLHIQLDNEFNEIVELLARELSHAKNDPRVHEEAESAIHAGNMSSPRRFPPPNATAREGALNAVSGAPADNTTVTNRGRLL